MEKFTHRFNENDTQDPIKSKRRRRITPKVKRNMAFVVEFIIAVLIVDGAAVYRSYSKSQEYLKYD